MRGFDSSSYGDAFADVYDEWYRDVSDVDSTVATLRMLGGEGPFLELGVGTGRIALPLAASGAHVLGIDSSTAMLDRLLEKQAGSPPGNPVVESAGAGGLVEPIAGDMVEDMPPGPFSAVFIAYNTLFSLGSRPLQQLLFERVARRLTPSGVFVVEASIPDVDKPAGGTVGVRSLAVDKVVLSVDIHDPSEQTVEGQFVEFTQETGVRLRPWRIRYCSVAELDAMAGAAGLELLRRWESMKRDEFRSDSPSHVSVYSART